MFTPAAIDLSFVRLPSAAVRQGLMMKNERLKATARSLRDLAILLLCALLVSFIARDARGQTPSEPQFRKGEVIVELKDDASIDDINARYGTTTIEKLSGTFLYRLQTPNQKKENKYRKRLSRDP